MDNKELVAGATLYLPVHIDGALFSVGDGFGAQGDGEVCITAIETGLVGTFELHVRDDMTLEWPFAETPTHIITMAFDPDLDDAVVIALRDMIRLICARTGISREDAYTLCSFAADLRVTQVVNGAKGIHVMLEKAHLARKALARSLDSGFWKGSCVIKKLMRRLLRLLDAEKAEPLHHRLVGDPQHQRILGGLVAMRPPCRRGDNVAAAPLEAFAVNRGGARAFDDGVDVVRGRLQRRRFSVRVKPHHVQADCRHRRIAELHTGAEWAGGVGLAASSRLSVSLSGNTKGKSLVGAAPGERACVSAFFLGRFEEHRLKQLHQRHVEKIEPIGTGTAVVAVAVARPVRCQQHVAWLHRDLDTVDLGIGAGLGIQNEPQRIRRMAMRARPFARHDHLIGGDQRAYRAVAVVGGRIEQNEIAPLGKLGVDQPAGGIERAARLLVFPLRRRERLLRRRPQRGVDLAQPGPMLIWPSWP